jgi:hypothetical protein
VHVLRGLDVHDRRFVVGRFVIGRVEQRLVERIQQRFVVGQFWRGLVRQLHDGQVRHSDVRLSHARLLRVAGRLVGWDWVLRVEAGRRSERLHERR